MARDPARIDRILTLLRAYWLARPGLRLGQIVGNLTPDLHDPLRKGDPYYVEDHVIEAALRDALRHRGG